MYNYYQPQQNTNFRQPAAPQLPSQMLTQPQIGLKGRPVSSVEEVRAASIDFDGSIFFFPDLGNKRIFTKQINMDGTCSLYMYELKELPLNDVPVSNNFVTREEFTNTLNEIRSLITPQLQQNQLQQSPVPIKEEEKKFEF